MKTIKTLPLLLLAGGLCFAFIAGCKSSTKGKVDVSDVKNIPVYIFRFDSALFTVDPGNLQEQLKTLAPKFPFFLGGDLDDTLNLMQMHDFITDPEVIQVSRYCQVLYPDLSGIELAFTEAFRYYRHYFPGKPQPAVYTYVSNYADVEFPVKYIDSTLIIALDMYLGKKFKSYLETGIPVYKINRMSREFILPDCMKEIASTDLIPDMDNKTLLDEMIREGKKLYFADLTLSALSDEVKIGYTPSQLKWCFENEENIWVFMIENKLLYSTYFQAFSKFVTDGPFTADFSTESPAKTGNWIGWQIVRAYMKNNPDVTPMQLMKNQDSQRILTEAHYKPGK
jgi:hypothetical protein